jgi:hypothetical protein
MADDAEAEAKTAQDFVAQWVQAIDAARDEEKEWRNTAGEAMKVYRAEKGNKAAKFNLFHSNIEIIVPSALNSMPVPDVRRRFGDADPVGKVVSEILERAISYCADVGKYDAKLKLALYDTTIAGRGGTRTRYVPTIEKDPVLGVDRITGEELQSEFVPYKRFIRGPGQTWDDVPWIAYEHFLPREEVAKLAPDLVDKIPFDHSAVGKDGTAQRAADKTPAQFRRAHFYEIWDKTKREVIFIAPDFKDGPAKVEPDPLGLKNFWPQPEPMQVVANVDGLVPVCPMSVYEGLLDDLNDISKRTAKLVKQLRPRGGYIGNNLDIKPMIEADDGEMVPLQGTEMMLANGTVNVNNLLTWFPMEPTILAIRELMAQREAVKQTIYEVTGIADIIRGASDPRETLGAQNLKAQFGSVRIRSLQAEVARYIRDDFEIKAELFAKRFQPETLMAITGMVLLTEQQKQQAQQLAQANPQQAEQIAAQQPEILKAMSEPSLDEVMALMRSDKMRGYRVDIETDSTIQGDMSKFQAEMAAFLGGTAQYLQSIGPMVQQGAVPAEAAVELYAGFARNFRLGKAAEDALDRLAEQARESAGQPDQEKEGQANAEREKLAAQQQTEQAKIDLERERMAVEQANRDREYQLKQYEIEAADSREREKMQREFEARQSEAAMKTMVERERAQASAKPTTMVSLDAGSAMGQLTEVLSAAIGQQDQKLSDTQAALATAMQSLTAPRRVVRDPQTGRAIGSEVVTQ